MDSFVSPLVTLFAYKGFNVSIVAFQSEKPQEAIDVIYHGLAVYTCSPFLLGGFAMAGTLMQMFSERLNHLSGVISISTLGFVDYLLKKHIGYLISLFNKGNLKQAIIALDQFVVSDGKLTMNQMLIIPESLRQTAIDRMKTRFSLLLNSDA